ncbi:nSTAND1 domain-containing NTPase [Streptomyces sp. NPDC004014]
MAGRRENPVDPAAGPVARFAAELRELRSEAGSPTYRTMAQRTGQGASTLSQAAAGERLPTLPVVLAYAGVCGGDPAWWEARWRDVAAEVAAEPRAEDAEAPYRGLARFEPGDAGLFFGRDRLTGRLLDLAASRRFVSVFGPSGSGKSSLLRAGLVPRLRAPAGDEPRPAALRVLTPGAHPMRTHAERLVPDGRAGDTWLIVDQFEEVFTLCTDRAERDRFIDRLLTATDPAGRLRVVIAVRADFLGRCTEHAELTAALQDGSMLVGPMSRDELREAVVRPAQAGGLIVERSLTARVLDEVEGEPGALPLMSHALLETWHRRKGRALTEAAYDGAGGLHGAVARTAESVFSRLTPGQAEAARRILLRTVAPGDGTQDTRRPVSRAELGADGAGDGATVLERLARARLVTLDNDTVDLAHEALITAWPRLRGWIDNDRERLRAHRRLTEAAQAWEALNRDAGALYRGTRLATVEETFTERGDLTDLEHAFLAASVAARRGEQRAAARTTRRLRTLVAGLTALVLVTAATAVVAFQQRATARVERAVAISRQIAAEAEQLRGTHLPPQVQNVSLAAQLDIASYRMRSSPRTYTSLLTAANSPLFSETPDQSRSTDGGSGAGSGRLAADASRHLMALAGADGAVRLWDIRDVSRPTRVGRSLPGSVVALSADGNLLAAEDGTDGRIRLWDTSDPRHPAGLTSLRIPDGVVGNTVALSPDGRLLAASGERVHLWDLRDPRHPALLDRSLPGDLTVFSPRGHLLATASFTTGTAWLWSTADLARPRTLGTVHLGDLGAQELVFRPDGRMLAVNQDARVRLWDIADPRHPKGFSSPLVTADDSEVGTVAFSPDGGTVAVAGDNGVQLWVTPEDDVEPTRQGEPLGQTTYDGIALVFGRDSHSLITDDRVIRVWSLPPVLPRCFEGTAEGISPDGRTMATTCGAARITLWDTTDSGRPRRLADLPGTSAVFAPRGRLLAVAEPDGGTRLWDAADPARPRRLGRTSVRHDQLIASQSFSADGRTLAEVEQHQPKTLPLLDAAGGAKPGRKPGLVWGDTQSSLDSRIRLWDVGDPGRPRLLGTTALGKRLLLDRPSVALSPDGRSLALTDSTGPVRLWDTRDPSHPARVARTVTGDVIAFAGHGHTLAVASADGTLRLWTLADPVRPRPLGPPADASGLVSALAFGPGAGSLATGTADGMIRLWDVTDPARPLATGDALVGHTGAVDRAVLGPGSGTLATSGADGMVKLWNLDIDRIVHHICDVTGHALDRAQWRNRLGSVPYRPPCGGRTTHP